jgi:hypothetical protein
MRRASPGGVAAGAIYDRYADLPHDFCWAARRGGPVRFLRHRLNLLRRSAV